MLPEMCFTGYTFTSRQDIEPYLESRSGPSLTWAQGTAKRLNCWVLVGFPFVELDKAYNALGVVDRSGSVRTVYFKHFLFETDEAWATEGPSFKCLPDTEFGTVGRVFCPVFKYRSVYISH